MIRRLLSLSLFIATCCLISLGQMVTYTQAHRDDKMQQFLVQETGVGNLSPSLYYSWFHKTYKREAHATSKTVTRTLTLESMNRQKGYAEDIDSVMHSRQTKEAIRGADLLVKDGAWAAEKSKLERAMAAFSDHVSALMQYPNPDNPSESANIRQFWEEERDMFLCAIESIQTINMPTSEQQRAFLEIHAEILRRDAALAKELMYARAVSKMTRPDPTADPTKKKHPRKSEIIRETSQRWVDAGWKAQQRAAEAMAEKEK